MMTAAAILAVKPIAKRANRRDASPFHSRQNFTRHPRPLILPPRNRRQVLFPQGKRDFTSVRPNFLAQRRTALEARSRAKLFLDAQKLAVFRDAVGAAGGTRLDLSCAGRHCEIRD